MIERIIKRALFLVLIYFFEILFIAIPSLWILNNEKVIYVLSNTKMFEGQMNLQVYDDQPSVIAIDQTSSDNIDTIKEKINQYEDELSSYVSNYNISIKYHNLTTGDDIEINPTKQYYSASVFKLIDVLYINDKNIDLDSQIKVRKNKLLTDSECLSSFYNNGTIKLKNIVTCLISYSDNYAHHLIVDEYGFNSFLDYSNSLNTKYKIREGDYLGSLNLSDAYLYITKAYEIIKNDSFYQSIFSNYVFNYLNIGEMAFYHKYGIYGNYYHDTGISITEEPYALIILSLERNNPDLEDIFHNISSLVFKINDLRNKVWHYGNW